MPKAWQWITDQERNLIWQYFDQGWDKARIGRQVGRGRTTVRWVLSRTPHMDSHQCGSGRICRTEREFIARQLKLHTSFAEIARLLDRPTSTVSREVNNNGGRSAYRPDRAHERARRCRARPKEHKLFRSEKLFSYVEALLKKHHSPPQIAQKLRMEFPGDCEMTVSHEAIYQALYVQAKSTFKQDLTRYLRTHRARRRPHGRSAGIGPISDKVMIADRPPEVDDRAVPGHWEGDLIMGEQNRSAIATLVERTTRFVLLIALPDSHDAETVADALARHIKTLPTQLRRSLTWDQGSEMAKHKKFSIATDVAVYFCDPHSPWQRGTNENTNGLLRDYFPKGTDLSWVTQEECNRVAAELNARIRQTLDWQTPSDRFQQLVAMTA